MPLGTLASTAFSIAVLETTFEISTIAPSATILATIIFPNLFLATNHLSPYTKKVLRTTLTVPLGYVTSYGEIAKAVGGGPRAVGNIMASNPFPPIVPCHRVVRANFFLGGYGFGIKTKIELLRREKQGFSSSREIEVQGGRLTVYPVEQVLRNFA